MKEEITLLKDEDWSLIDGELCRVIEYDSALCIHSYRM